MKIFIKKNDYKKEDKHPDLKLFMITGKDGDKSEFHEIGALWKAKSGSGYSGSIDEQKVKQVYTEKEEALKVSLNKISYPENDLGDIGF